MVQYFGNLPEGDQTVAPSPRTRTHKAIPCVSDCKLVCPTFSLSLCRPLYGLFLLPCGLGLDVRGTFALFFF